MLTMTKKDIAAIWGVSVHRMHQMIQSGDLLLEQVSPGRYRVADVAFILGVSIDELERRIKKERGE